MAAGRSGLRDRHGRIRRSRFQAALDGFGVAYIPEDLVLPYLKAGRLKRVLEKFCPKLDGYYLYYPSRRHPSAAFVAVLDALRHRARQGRTS